MISAEGKREKEPITEPDDSTAKRLKTSLDTVHPLTLQVEFTGGAELLFPSKSLKVSVDKAQVSTVAHLIAYLRDKMVTNRPELFSIGGTVRPGILVLIDDTDWEVVGGLTCALAEGMIVTFISTLHGG